MTDGSDGSGQRPSDEQASASLSDSSFDSSGTGARRRSGEVDLGTLPRRLGRYEVLDRIGAGGMGTVFRARQIPMDRTVALKVLASALSKDKRYLKRFVREARAAGALDHPNIVRVHDVGNAEGFPYICMEYIDGCSVEKLLRERERLSPAESIEVAIRVAEALEHAHKAGIVHCDVKPDNIIIDKRGMAKLADLGLARKYSSTSAESGTFHGIGMGTPHYVSMEQARDIRNADRRSDIYSLGATLYHIMTGRVPHEGKSTFDIMIHMAQEPLVKPSELVPGITESLDGIVEKMMARDPDDRYQDAPSLLHDLRAIRAELAGFGPADLFSVVSKPTPTKSPSGVLYVLAACITAVAFAGAIASGVKSEKTLPAPTPEFVPALPVDMNTEADESEPELEPGETDEGLGPRLAVPETGDDEPETPEVGPEPDDQRYASPALDEVSRQVRWLARAGRYGAAEKSLSEFASSMTGTERDKALEALQSLHMKAEQESIRVLARADSLLAAGRVEKALSLLSWALEIWGMPVLEAKAEDALAKARRNGEEIEKRRRRRSSAETDARGLAARAEELAANRRFSDATILIVRAMERLKNTGSPELIELIRRKAMFDALGGAHRQIIRTLSKRETRILAGDVFPTWPSPDAVLTGSDEERVYIALNDQGAQAGRRWEDLTRLEFAKLAERCIRTGIDEDNINVGLAYYEADRPEEAMKLWNRIHEPIDFKALPIASNRGEPVTQALNRARALDASGREYDALRELLVAIRTAPAPDDLPAEIRRFVASLYDSVRSAAGLSGSHRYGLGEAIELVYDFSKIECRDDWKMSGARLRQAELMSVSPSGSHSQLEFDGTFVGAWEVALWVRFMETTDCRIEVTVLPDSSDAAEGVTARLSASDVIGPPPADGGQPLLARRVHNVIVFRRWGELCWGAGTGSGRILLDRNLQTGCPDGPERLVVRLVGWVELHRIRIRGVADPAWLEARRRTVTRGELDLLKDLGEVPPELERE